MDEDPRLPGLYNFAGAYLNEDMTTEYGDEWGALAQYVREHADRPRLLVRLLEELDEVLSWDLPPGDLEHRLVELDISFPLPEDELLPYLQAIRRAAAEALVDVPEER